MCAARERAQAGQVAVGLGCAACVQVAVVGWVGARTARRGAWSCLARAVAARAAGQVACCRTCACVCNEPGYHICVSECVNTDPSVLFCSDDDDSGDDMDISVVGSDGGDDAL